MKKVTLIFSFALFALVSFAAMPGYVETMESTIAEYAKCRGQEDFVALANKFERIARAEKEEWLPSYYHAHCLIIASFIEQSDANVKNGYLDQAEPSMDKVMAMASDNAEAHVLQALFYTARLVVDPANLGQKYGALSGQSAAIALHMDPENPRARYMEIQNAMGQAQFFGEDVSKYCTQANEVLASFDGYKRASSIHPNWGKEDLQRLVNTCK